ncbi:MAG TPA: NADH-quinone oxidoreductase subunit C [bacterium]|nr:NADH-quinone oxidoreductase subunit C [bacterium]
MSMPLTGFADRFKTRALAWEEKRARRLYVEIRPSDLLETANYLYKDCGCRFVIATATDIVTAITVLYHFAHDASGVMVNIRVTLDRDKPAVESLTQLFVGAEWIEREMWELLGITFIHHPGLKHLLLPDDWPNGVHPLRQDFRQDELPPPCPGRGAEENR